MVKNLIFFDFDNTLIDSPTPEWGMEYWERETGSKWPYVGWWSKPESLDIEVFDIKPRPEILSQYKKWLGVPDTRIYILTSRMDKLRGEVEKVLEHNNIVVDEIIMRQDSRLKSQRVEEEMEKYPGVGYVLVLDDRDKEIQDLSTLVERYPEVKIEIIKV